MKQLALSFFCGFIFAVGLVISGMTQPQIIIGFLDPLNWNPTLLYVIVGALIVHSFSYFLVRKRKTPFFETQWHIPRSKKIDSRLVLGALIFGSGWGLAGYCPGPAITSIPSANPEIFGFVLALFAGMKTASLFLRRSLA